MVRDEEIQRLISYIKGIGLKVSFTSKDKDASALWTLDNTEITICKKYNTTKIETILSLIHEISHAIHNIHEKKRQIDPKVERAVDHLDRAEELGTDSQKRHRKALLDHELAGVSYWDSVYRETQMSFPIWRLEMAKEFDIYQYETFYETGTYPTAKERKIKMKELRNKYRG